ncbi:Histidine kinase [Chitinophaga sp. CF118]|uniref:sensor histidine kinase n=1 Tax=Chitinophaga sp. CF118 TaxID=1884367 RepID=UPI0008EBE243|nr:histidine kinase [Chitinophaga sp. CF118]SFD98432.1 Histidine kinase [Chitinophaga sp. CF118]
MRFNVLVKELIRYSGLMAIIIFVSSFIILYTFRLGNNPTPVLYAFLVGARSVILSIINILIIIMLHEMGQSVSEKKKKFIRYSLSYILAFIFFLLTNPLEQYLSHPVPGMENWPNYLPAIVVQCAMNNSIVLIMHNFVILQFKKASTDLEISRLSAANVESANLLLRQQIHPHFLFNALSMLKSLYKSDIHAGEAYLTHLVNFLRASLAESHSRVSRLSDEINLCNDYLAMQKIRFEDALVCIIEIPKFVLLQGSVPLFSIQSLIENAIKHNEATDSSPLVIKVFYKEGRIITENNLQVRNNIDAPSGKGLINLIERYRILSNDEVIISQENSTFSVSIKVLSNEDSNN